MLAEPRLIMTTGVGLYPEMKNRSRNYALERKVANTPESLINLRYNF